MKSRPEGGYTFFTDRDLGPNARTDVVRILTAGGLKVESHDENFSYPAKDHEWLGLCGNNGWVGITRDRNIRYKSPLAKEVIMRRDVPLFILIGTWPFHRLAQNFVNSIDAVEHLVRQQSRGFIAKVNMQSDEEKYRRNNAGKVTVWLTHEQWLKGRRSR